MSLNYRGADDVTLKAWRALSDHNDKFLEDLDKKIRADERKKIYDRFNIQIRSIATSLGEPYKEPINYENTVLTVETMRKAMHRLLQQEE